MCFVLSVAGFPNHFRYSLNVTDNGAVSALCVSPIRSISHCSIQFSRDRSYTNLSFPNVGPMNTLFYFMLSATAPGVYYHQASVVINSSLEIVVHSGSAFALAKDFQIPESDNTTFLNEPSGVVTLKLYQLVLLGMVIGILLLCLAISNGAAVLQFQKSMLFIISIGKINVRLHAYYC